MVHLRLFTIAEPGARDAGGELGNGILLNKIKVKTIIKK